MQLNHNQADGGRIAFIAGVSLFIMIAGPLSAQPGPGPLGPGPGCNLFPAPPSVGANVDLTYFGPAPSELNPSLVGPNQLLRSGVVDAKNGTITLPLYKGFLKAGAQGAKPKNIWYVLTDVNDANVAAFLGINYSAKLSYAGSTARTANFDDNGTLIFDQGTVDFSPVRTVTAGSPTAFPPATAQPGAVGDANYSPLVRVLNAGGMIYNATMIAFDVDANQLNFPMVNGYSFGRPLWYLTLDASTQTGAALEGVIFAPNMQRVKLGGDDSFSSAVERLFLAINGASDGACQNPQRQGITAAILDGHRPNNVLGGIPNVAPDYSPLWEAQPYEWTADAVAKGYRGLLTEEFRILSLVQDGYLTGPGGAKFGSNSFIVNCPPAIRLN